MGAASELNNAVLLLDGYGPDSQNLHNSFKLSGCELPAVVVEDDGFLPEDVCSVYGYFLGDFHTCKTALGRPRYFNEIPVPDYWEISSTNASGKVSDLWRERARIFYASPTHERHVRIVDWVDENGFVRSSDHYNRLGALFARTSFNKKGEKVNKAFFSADGKEVLVENYVTRDIILNWEDGVHIFNSKVELICFFLRLTGYDQRRLFFNSLSTPFFVSCALPAGEQSDLLFWQEPIGSEIPGNMQMILDNRAPRTKRIYVQGAQAFDRLISLGANPDCLRKKGFVYPFKRENLHRPNALICTNSDQIEGCEALVRALPEAQFHIAALTEMSSKLLALGSIANVHLYPGAKETTFERLFGLCDFYLDINYGNEIVAATAAAFLNRQLILAFEETAHNRSFTAPEHLFRRENVSALIETLRKLTDSAEALAAALHVQNDHALAETPEAFLQL